MVICPNNHCYPLIRKILKFLNRISKVIFPDTQEINETIIRHYEENPDELDLIINREHFYTIYLGLIFILGMVMTVAARLIQYFYGQTLGDFVNTIVLDVLSELGIAIFGGAVVGYLIEFLNKRQFQQNIKFRRDIKTILEERKKRK